MTTAATILSNFVDNKMVDIDCHEKILLEKLKARVTFVRFNAGDVMT